MNTRCCEATTRIALVLAGVALVAVLFLTARPAHSDPARYAANFDAARACGNFTLVAGN